MTKRKGKGFQFPPRIRDATQTPQRRSGGYILTAFIEDSDIDSLIDYWNDTIPGSAVKKTRAVRDKVARQVQMYTGTTSEGRQQLKFVQMLEAQEGRMFGKRLSEAAWRREKKIFDRTIW